MNNSFVIPYRLPSLNEYIGACRVHPQKGAQFKREWQDGVCWIISQARAKGELSPVSKPCRVSFKYFEKTTKRDIDNVSGYAHKIVLDALVEMEILPNDTQKWVQGLSDTFVKSDIDGIMISIEEIETDV